ncbi:hypothetical protein SORBI_3009G134766 [Sorghum bicolor]|uniref:Uncharacterized protein n=1 Tax=Sorghum bicolor TaxID=4558 RepID=A0A1Z5R3G5_SORBI|nr:hypothetical protein SORBI_3009G134766 [Sorghum bicolor]
MPSAPEATRRGATGSKVAHPLTPHHSVSIHAPSLAIITRNRRRRRAGGGIDPALSFSTSRPPQMMPKHPSTTVRCGAADSSKIK